MADKFPYLFIHISMCEGLDVDLAEEVGLEPANILERQN